MRIAIKRIRFRSEGFAGVLTSPGVTSAVAAYARRRAAQEERESGVPYTAEPDRGWDGRSAYAVRPASGEGRVPNLDHETWMREVWPRVGGAPWRPH